MQGKVRGSLAAIGNTVTLPLNDINSLTVTVAGTFAAAGIIFEVSPDSTDGVTGQWFPCTGIRSNSGQTQENGFTNTSSVPTYYWHISPGSFEWFRVRCTGITTGAVIVTVCPMATPVQLPVPTGSSVAGQASHDSVISGSPVRIGAKSATAMPAAVSGAGDACDLVCTLSGALVVAPYSTPDSRRRGSAALSTTADVAVIAAAGTGLRNNVSDIVAINTGTAVDLIIKDGATEIFRLPLPQNVPVAVSLNSPLLGTANTAVNCALSAAGTVRVNLMGFIG